MTFRLFFAEEDEVAFFAEEDEVAFFEEEDEVAFFFFPAARSRASCTTCPT